MKEKKILVLIITLSLILLTVSNTFAAPPWMRGSNSFPPGLAKKFASLPVFVFSDVGEDFGWAKFAIDKMYKKGIIKGYGNNLFKPGKHVTHLEVIIMALRIMGWEDEIGTQSVPHIVKKTKLPKWALSYKYVALALEKGLIEPHELAVINFNRPAKRYEVCKYIIRAMGLKEEALEYMDKPIPFRDAEEIPEDSRGYVYLMWDLGLMKGMGNGLFLPNKPIRRAEMAVLMNRADRIIENDLDGGEFEGYVRNIDEDDLTITISLKGEDWEFEILDNALVYKDGRYISIDDIKEGDHVSLLLNDEGKAIFIEVKGEETDRVLAIKEGLVVDIDEKDGVFEIEILTFGNNEETYIITEETEIRIGYKNSKTEDLKEGMWITIKVNSENQVKRLFARYSIKLEGEVIEIEEGYATLETDNGIITLELADDVELKDVDNMRDVVNHKVKVLLDEGKVREIEVLDLEEEFEIEGVLKQIIIGDVDKIVIETDDEGHTYTVADACYIEADGEELELTELSPGLTVRIEVEDNEVEKIEVLDEGEEFEVEGYIREIDYDDFKILLEDEDGDYIGRYRVDEDVDVEIDDEDTDFEDLEEGYYVKLEGEDDVVYKIDAEIPEFEAKGVLRQIVIGDVNKIVVEVDGEDYTYEIAPECKIKLDGDEAQLTLLKPGMEVEIEGQNNRVVLKLEAESLEE